MIAAINGAAAGLGLVEALYCDVRFATPEAKLTTAFARRGLIAEYGISWLLPRLVGPSRPSTCCCPAASSRGEEALRLGLVDRLSEPERLVDDAVAYAAELAAHSSPWSMATIKAQVQADLERPFAEAVAAAEELMLASFDRADVAGGRAQLPRAPRARRSRPSTPGAAMNFELDRPRQGLSGARDARSWTSTSTRPSTVYEAADARRPATRTSTRRSWRSSRREARARGLWNLFHPDPSWGPGLTNAEYAPLAEIMGRSRTWRRRRATAPRPTRATWRCSTQFGTEEQKERWLRPLLDGEIRSAFAMTEPAVASSDATNIETRIERDGDEYVINGRKWWTSNALHPQLPGPDRDGQDRPGRRRRTASSR